MNQSTYKFLPVLECYLVMVKVKEVKMTQAIVILSQKKRVEMQVYVIKISYFYSANLHAELLLPRSFSKIKFSLYDMSVIMVIRTIESSIITILFLQGRFSSMKVKAPSGPQVAFLLCQNLTRDISICILIYLLSVIHIKYR